MHCVFAEHFGAAFPGKLRAKALELFLDEAVDFLDLGPDPQLTAASLRLKQALHAGPERVRRPLDPPTILRSRDARCTMHDAQHRADHFGLGFILFKYSLLNI